MAVISFSDLLSKLRSKGLLDQVNAEATGPTGVNFFAVSPIGLRVARDNGLITQEDLEDSVGPSLTVDAAFEKKFPGFRQRMLDTPGTRAAFAGIGVEFNAAGIGRFDADVTREQRKLQEERREGEVTGPPAEVEGPVTDVDVPGGIATGTDQFTLEQEGLRQQEQSRRALESQRELRSTRLTDLAGLLREQEEFQFGESRSTIAEESQAGGLLRSSGFGEALAREKARLATGTQQALAQQSLSDRTLDEQGISDILSQRQGFQGAALQRRFSLEDFERSANLSRSLGLAGTPQVRGGGKGDAAGQAAIGGISTGIGKAAGGG